jgi:hypothetical protein
MKYYGVQDDNAALMLTPTGVIRRGEFEVNLTRAALFAELETTVYCKVRAIACLTRCKQLLMSRVIAVPG